MKTIAGYRGYQTIYLEGEKDAGRDTREKN